eukprot:PhF_6_TR27946/c1_g1_i1/m.41212
MSHKLDKKEEHKFFVLVPRKNTFYRFQQKLLPQTISDTLKWKMCLVIFEYKAGQGLVTVFRDTKRSRKGPLVVLDVNDVQDVRLIALPQSQALPFQLDPTNPRSAIEYRYGQIILELCPSPGRLAHVGGTLKICCGTHAIAAKWIAWFSEVLVVTTQASLHRDEELESQQHRARQPASSYHTCRKITETEMDDFVQEFMSPKKTSPWGLLDELVTGSFNGLKSFGGAEGVAVPLPPDDGVCFIHYSDGPHKKYIVPCYEKKGCIKVFSRGVGKNVRFMLEERIDMRVVTLCVPLPWSPSWFVVRGKERLEIQSVSGRAEDRDKWVTWMQTITNYALGRVRQRREEIYVYEQQRAALTCEEISNSFEVVGDGVRSVHEENLAPPPTTTTESKVIDNNTIGEVSSTVPRVLGDLNAPEISIAPPPETGLEEKRSFKGGNTSSPQHLGSTLRLHNDSHHNPHTVVSHDDNSSSVTADSPHSATSLQRFETIPFVSTINLDNMSATQRNRIGLGMEGDDDIHPEDPLNDDVVSNASSMASSTLRTNRNAHRPAPIEAPPPPTIHFNEQNARTPTPNSHAVTTEGHNNPPTAATTGKAPAIHRLSLTTRVVPHRMLSGLNHNTLSSHEKQPQQNREVEVPVVAPSPSIPPTNQQRQHIPPPRVNITGTTEQQPHQSQPSRSWSPAAPPSLTQQIQQSTTHRSPPQSPKNTVLFTKELYVQFDTTGTNPSAFLPSNSSYNLSPNHNAVMKYKKRIFTLRGGSAGNGLDATSTTNISIVLMKPSVSSANIDTTIPSSSFDAFPLRDVKSLTPTTEDVPFGFTLAVRPSSSPTIPHSTYRIAKWVFSCFSEADREDVFAAIRRFCPTVPVTDVVRHQSTQVQSSAQSNSISTHTYTPKYFKPQQAAVRMGFSRLDSAREIVYGQNLGLNSVVPATPPAMTTRGDVTVVDDVTLPSCVREMIGGTSIISSSPRSLFTPHPTTTTTSAATPPSNTLLLTTSDHSVCALCGANKSVQPICLKTNRRHIGINVDHHNTATSQQHNGYYQKAQSLLSSSSRSNITLSSQQRPPIPRYYDAATSGVSVITEKYTSPPRKPYPQETIPIQVRQEQQQYETPSQQVVLNILERRKRMKGVVSS